MGVHSFHIFDRRGKTLFTKRYWPKGSAPDDDEQLSEQRKLIFGMVFSLRELVGSMVPKTEIRDPGLHSVRTGASTLHMYETANGLRFVLYTDNGSKGQDGPSIRSALRHIYTEIWVDSVVRSPLYRCPDDNSKQFDISSTNFEGRLDAYLGSMPWLR
mmetsp:Transcript_1323/g.1842  ORF Transcript_1323/g.1842 Transcript_1323/m.1842 type:complete len:158 (-) Transcript_1323:1205-1678(-)